MLVLQTRLAFSSPGSRRGQSWEVNQPWISVEFPQVMMLPCGKDQVVLLLPSSTHLLASIFALGTIEKWVLIVSIGIVLICAVGLVLWQLIAHLTGKLPKKPRIARRQSPEPPEPTKPSEPLTRFRASAESAGVADDPERLQQACTAAEESLAQMYWELAESWSQSGHPQKAAAALRKILQICPETAQAQLAKERLEKIGKDYLLK